MTGVQTCALPIFEKWANQVNLSLRPLPPSAIPALSVDLAGNTGPRFAEEFEPASTLRQLDLEQLGRTLRQNITLLKQGHTPAMLGLGEDARQPGCENLLMLFYIQWCRAGTGRGEPRNLIEEKAQFIRTNRPRVEQFMQIRSQFVQEQLEQARQDFSDKELANKAHFNELRDKLSKEWKGAEGSYIPGVKNIDLLSSDEYLLGLIRDGMKFREGPKVKNAGGSLAATNKPVARAKTSPTPATQQLQERANKGDKNAARDLLATMLAANRQRRS